jgi:membrane protein
VVAVILSVEFPSNTFNNPAMATLGDVRPVLKSCGTWSFFRRLWQQINEDDIFVWASALAYSWLFAIFPFLILLLSLVPYLPARAKDSAYRSVTKGISEMLGKEAPTLNDNLHSVMQNHSNGWLGIGLIVTIWVASGGMAMTMSALNRCYDVKETRSYIKRRWLAVAITVGVAVGMMFIITLIPIGTAVETWLSHTGGITLPFLIAFDAVRYFLSLVFAILVLAIIYYYGPNIRQRFRWISPGALFSGCVWILLDVAFRFYVDRFARYNQTYGSVGGAAILLLFFYIDGLVLLIGAEINSEIDFERLGVVEGSRDFTGPVQKELSDLPEIAKEL